MFNNEPVNRVQTYKETDYPPTLFDRDPQPQRSYSGRQNSDQTIHDRHDDRQFIPDNTYKNTHVQKSTGYDCSNDFNTANSQQRAPAQQQCYSNNDRRNTYQDVHQINEQPVCSQSYTNSGKTHEPFHSYERVPYNGLQKHDMPGHFQQTATNNVSNDRFSYGKYAPQTAGQTKSNYGPTYTQGQSLGEPMGPSQNFDNYAPQQYRRKPKDPKPFDGSKIEWCDYLHHFLGVAEYNGWSEREMAKHLTMAFDGNALKYLSEFSEETLTNFELLVQELFRKHDPAERAEAWKIEFKNRKRRPKEPFSDFAQELKRLVSKAYPKMPKVATDQWILDSFIQGIQNIDMQRHIQFLHPKDVNEAISAAVEYDAFESSNLDKVKKPLNAEVQSIQYKPNTNNTEMQTLKNEMSEIKSLLKQNQNTSTNTSNANRNNTTFNSNYKNNQNGQNNGQKFDKKNAECYFCHKKGHLKDECRKLKAKIEREAYRVMNEPISNNTQGN